MIKRSIPLAERFRSARGMLLYIIFASFHQVSPKGWQTEVRIDEFWDLNPELLLLFTKPTFIEF